MKKILILFIALLTVTNITSCNADSNPQDTPVEKIKIGGSSEGYPVLEILAKAKNDDSTEITFMPSSQSS
ncbi:MAG: hypothetical protein F6K39_33050, partial [Okeania sp. SIO3B3]|nr:hypothetical protein [Okeania sp. SIO3B3]